MSSSVHRRTFGEWISSLINRPYRHVDTGWRRKPVEQPVAQAPVQPPIVQPTTTVYPVLPPRPYVNGDSVRTYRHSHPVVPTVAPKIVHLTELPKEQYFQATNGMSLAAIQAANTVKRLSPEMLPPQVSGQIPTCSGMLSGNREIMERARLGHPTHLEPVPPGQVSQSLWVGPSQAPSEEWLVQEPTLPTRRDSSYLVCQQPTLHFWEEFTSIARPSVPSGDLPTLEVPTVMKQRVERRYKESE